jgi:hypothetical protein
MSKNALTIEQLKLACRHVLELIEAGMSENLAIRSLEIYANYYAKYRVLGKVTPDHADQYDYWSKAARKAKLANPNRPYGQYLRVEHGTPRRHFARLVLEAFKKQKLTKTWMNRVCDKRWKVAVVTHAEDKRLSEGGRSTLLETPEARWSAAKIKF